VRASARKHTQTYYNLWSPAATHLYGGVLPPRSLMPITADLSPPSFSSPITPDFFDQTQDQDAV